MSNQLQPYIFLWFE